MKVTLSEGIEITIDPNRLLDAMTKEQRDDMVSHLSCHDTIINNVKEQLIHGYFDPDGKGIWIGAIQAAQREVVGALSDMHKRELDRFALDLQWAKDLAQEGWDRYHEAIKQRDRY
jgi:hypothetical protein